jgi:hypothetical protein
MERLITVRTPTALRRRGVLLLIVLSLLTLFMMLGATYLVIATRAKATARAFANVVAGAQSTPSVQTGHAFLDEAFLRIVRGTASGRSGVISNADTLLGDKYGLPLTGTTAVGTIVAGSTSGTAVIATTAKVVGTGTEAAEALSGRVLTFTTPGLTNASVRILRAEPDGSNVRLYLPGGPTLSGASLSQPAITSSANVVGTGTTHFVINGREFASGTSGPNEPWDGFDERNDFLANPISPVTRPSFVSSGSLGTSGARLAVDNDGDGTLDSAWLDIGLPPLVNAAGETLYPRAAILITDLDGRLNVNAHGSRSEFDNSATLYSGTFATGVNALTNVTSATTSLSGSNRLPSYPRGLGVGPAEIALENSGLFESAGSTTGLLALSGIDAVNPGTDQTLQQGPPKVGIAEGRYGGLPLAAPSSATFPRPGQPYANDSVTATPQSWIAATGTSYFTSPLRFASPPDLKGIGRLFLDDFGQPIYYRPYWSNPGGRPPGLDNETVDDPYEVNLSRLGPRTGAIVNPVARGSQIASGSSADFRPTNLPGLITDNLYTAGDLEGLLRAYDIDSPKLSRRLPALCGTNSGTNRLLLTTESWDTSAMTGAARAAVSALIATSSTASGMSPSAAMNMFAPETLMGQKFDLNRPFHLSDQREPNDAAGKLFRANFAKQLYALVFALAGRGKALDTDDAVAAERAKELAQWAVNVVDFRDQDAVMTRFEYDTDLTNGWNTDPSDGRVIAGQRAVVWGCERPEVLITETVCWHDRNTDDLPPGGLLTADDAPDTDFDQAHRPQGAFFFELYSPWRAQAAEYGNGGIQAANNVIDGGVNGNTASALRADALPPELMATQETAGTNALARFDAQGAIGLSATTANGNHPAWRLITFKNTATGTTSDPVVATTGTAWRTFYFRQPPIDLVRSSTNKEIASGTTAVAYWPSTASISLSPHTPIVFGTGTSFTIAGSGTSITISGSFVQMNRLFASPSGTNSGVAACKATLTEPAITSGTNAAIDPYAVLHTQTMPPAGLTWPLPAASANPRPLDDLQYANAGITAHLSPTGAASKTLMQNGRHANFFFAHLQRLADPAAPWDAENNPYMTVDSLPVDVLVFNTLSSLTSDADKGKNCDEPCGPGSAFSGLQQREYSDADKATLKEVGADINVERGNTEASSADDLDIWSARVNPNVSGAQSLLTITGVSRPAKPIAPGPPKSLAASPAPVRTGTSAHSLGRLSKRLSTSGTVPIKPFPWMTWNNRPFASAAELAVVPRTSSFDLLRSHSTAAGAGSDKAPEGAFAHLPGFFEPAASGTANWQRPPWDRITGREPPATPPADPAPSIWDAVHVPTPFGGSYQDVPMTSSGTAALTTIGLADRPYAHFPHFREPGRINVNTITGTSVWASLLGTGTAGTQIQAWTPSAPPFNEPAKTLLEALGRFHTTVSGTTSYIDTYAEPARDSASHSFFRYQTVSRMANLVTVRSNVFAVWVTIGYSTDPSPTSFTEAGIDTGDIRRHRGFYIFDRSIPVGFDPGQDLNVRDAILLRRIIQ